MGGENQALTEAPTEAVPETNQEEAQVTKKKAVAKKKQVPAAKKKTVPAAAKKTAAAAGRGRVSTYAGKKIEKLVTVTGNKVSNAKGKVIGALRETGFVRDCWNVIKDGMSVDSYRAKAPDYSLSRKVLADFIKKGYVKVA